MAVTNPARKIVKSGTGKTVLKSYLESQTAAKLLVVSQPVLVSPLTSEPTCVALMRSVQPRARAAVHVELWRDRTGAEGDRQLGEVFQQVGRGGVTPAICRMRLARRVVRWDGCR